MRFLAADGGERVNLLQIFGFAKRPQPPDEERDNFCHDYSAALARLREIRNNFDFADDEALTDALIFEENAALRVIDRLIREAKTRNITIDFCDFLRKNA